MSFEKIRVNARLKLIGRVKTGNLLVAFSVFLRIAVYTLAVLVLLHFDDYYKSVNGRAFLALCGAGLFFGVLLLWCARTVKDRWYAALSDGCYMNVIDIITRFKFYDVLNSVSCGLFSSISSLIRVIAFCGFPTAAAVLIISLVNSGISRAVFLVMMCGFIAVVGYSAFFLAVSLNCVSLARSFCFCSVHRFKYILRLLEKNCFNLLRFSLFLSIFNRCVRRFSKLEFARLIALYTF